MFERIEPRPAIERIFLEIDEAIAKTARHTKTAVVCRAPANADDQARLRMLVADAQKQLAKPKRVEFKWMKNARLKHRQPDNTGAFDNSSAGIFAPPPRHFHRLMSRVDGGGGTTSRLQKVADDFSEPIAPIAHWQEIERVMWTR